VWVKNIYWSSRKVPFIIVRFWFNFICLDRYLGKCSNIKFHFKKIHSAEAESFHVEGRKYMTKLTVAFRNFANASKMDNGFRNNQPHSPTHLLSFLNREFTNRLDVRDKILKSICCNWRRNGMAPSVQRLATGVTFTFITGVMQSTLDVSENKAQKLANPSCNVGRDSAVGIANHYGLNGPRIESR